MSPGPRIGSGGRTLDLPTKAVRLRRVVELTACLRIDEPQLQLATGNWQLATGNWQLGHDTHPPNVRRERHNRPERDPYGPRSLHQPNATFLGRSRHDQRKRSLGPVIRHIDMDKLLFEILA